MYYTLTTIQGLSSEKTLNDIESKLGKTARNNFTHFVMSLIDKASHSIYLNELSNGMWLTRIALEKTGQPTIFTFNENHEGYKYYFVGKTPKRTLINKKDLANWSKDISLMKDLLK